MYFSTMVFHHAHLTQRWVLDMDPQCEILFDICKTELTQGRPKDFLHNLALIDSDKWDKTAHAKRYGVDISPNVQNIIFKRMAVLHF